MNEKWKTWFKAAGIRALRTVAQSLASTLPVGLVITPVMIQSASWSMLYIVLAWLATGLLAGVASLLTSLSGLPEVELKEANELLLKKNEESQEEQ